MPFCHPEPRLLSRPRPPNIYSISFLAGPGGGGASREQRDQKQAPPLVFTPDGRLPQRTKLSDVVTDAVRRWYLEAESEMQRGDVVRAYFF